MYIYLNIQKDKLYLPAFILKTQIMTVAKQEKSTSRWYNPDYGNI